MVITQRNSRSQEFLVHGQGIILFKCKYYNQCVLEFHSETGSVTIQFTPMNIYAVLRDPECTHSVLIDKENTKGLCDKKHASYWISLDSQNQKLCAGIGEARTENKFYTYAFDRNQKKFLESLTTVSWVDTVKPFLMLRDPIIEYIPLKVANTNMLTLDEIDAFDEYIPHSYLSSVCQKLYSCVSGKKICLDSEDFPEFSKAIQYSIVTPGLWCHETLKKKATEFDPSHPNDKETYLRITLNNNSGESPGIPFVLEIWPSGHFSPIHNHGGANAIIRVLHGSINVKLFPFLCENSEIEPFAEADMSKDEITWISPELNQVHQLHNITDDVCVTIQCYMYNSDDQKHYDYFDYLDAENHKQKFEPDSDMGFTEFKKLMRKEYNAKSAVIWSVDKLQCKLMSELQSIQRTVKRTVHKRP
jgi:predicted metal-dependent enzyme (double-stranded beta helix superfamily)